MSKTIVLFHSRRVALPAGTRQITSGKKRGSDRFCRIDNFKFCRYDDPKGGCVEFIGKPIYDCNLVVRKIATRKRRPAAKKKRGAR